MAPIFFENFKLQKRKITMKTIGTLLNPKNGITPHVRNLFIVNGCWEKEECWKNGVIIDPMLQLVVGAFPQDRLRALVGDDEIVLDTTLLVSLLQHQSRLKRLAVYHRMRPDGHVIDLEDKNLVSWAASRCADVESLTVVLRTDYVDTYTPAEFLVRSAPNIKDLKIKEHGNQKHPALPLLRPLGTWGKVGYNAFGGLAAEDEDGRAKLELSHMSLEHVALDSRSLGSIRKHVELPRLQSLEMLRCPEAHLLLTALQPGCNLTKLIFEQANAHIRTFLDKHRIEGLLNSFSGLRVLSLSLYDRMVDVSCIIHHGSSLRQLGIHCYSTCLSADDLEELLQSSPHLEGLGVDFCKVRLGEVAHAISNFKLAQMHGEAHAASELETYLTIISAHDTLKCIRIYTPPVIELYDEWRHAPDAGYQLADEYVEVMRTIMQHFATEILSYMSALGSKVKFWGMMPNAVDENENESSVDANGHQWPRYYYVRSRVSIDEMLEGEENTKVVAAPTTLDDGLMEDTVFTQVFDTIWSSACGQERRFLGHTRSKEPPPTKYDGEEQTSAARGRTQRT
ncbi:unnamed protein product [Alternaria alternata]